MAAASPNKPFGLRESKKVSQWLAWDWRGSREESKVTKDSREQGIGAELWRPSLPARTHFGMSQAVVNVHLSHVRC